MTLTQVLDNQQVTYSAYGIVIGRDWGFGITMYPSIRYDNFKSLEDLEQAISQGIKDKSIDSGMGYESVFGCMMQISVNTNLLINDKIFTNVEQEDKIYGEDVRLSQYTDSLEDYFYEWINSQYN